MIIHQRWIPEGMGITPCGNRILPFGDNDLKQILGDRMPTCIILLYPTIQNFPAMLLNN